MWENPDSVEFKTLEDRKYYISFPPGSVIPLYVLGKTLSREPNTDLAVSYNLANHFILALVISSIAVLILNRFRINKFLNAPLALMCGLLVIFLPGPMYWMQNVYNFDESVMVPSALLVFLMLFRQEKINNTAKKIISFVQVILIFWGTLIDPFFLFVVLAAWLVEFFLLENKSIKDLLKSSPIYVMPMLLALGLYAYQIYSLKAFSYLKERFLFRTAMGDSGAQISSTLSHQLKRYVMAQYGVNFTLILIVALVAVFFALVLYLFLRKRKKKPQDVAKIVWLTSLIVIPPILHTYLFKNLYAMHDFTVLKYAPVYILVSFIIVPLLIISFARYFRGEKKDLIRQIVVISLTLLAAAFILKNIFFGYKIMFTAGDPGIKKRASFIKQNTLYKDVVFSPAPEVTKDYMTLFYAEKKVYPLNFIDDIKQIVEPIESDYTVDIMVKSGDEESKNKFASLLKLDENPLESDSYLIYKISKTDFAKFLAGNN
jgi:hypothetical protein